MTTLLILDDNDAITALLLQQIKFIDPKINIVSVKTVKGALDVINEFDFVGVILDLILPDDLSIKVAEVCEKKNIPVVFMTGVDDDHNVKLMLEYGWVLNKPVSLVKIKRTLNYFKNYKR